MKFSSLFSRPFLAKIDNSSSGELLLLFAIDGKIGFDFFGLKLNLNENCNYFLKLLVYLNIDFLPDHKILNNADH